MVSQDRRPIYSYSQLNAFQTCPYSWHLLYEEHVPRETNAFSSYGTLVHELLQECAEGKIQRSALADLFDWRFEADVPEPFPPNRYVDLRERYHDQGVEFFNQFEGFSHMEILGIEKHFKIDRGAYILQGFIDLIYRDQQGRLTFRDWKSSKAYSRKELAEHRRQVYLYAAHCIEQYGHPPDQLEFYHFRDQRKRSVIPFRQEEYEEALAWSDQKAEELQTAWDFPYHYDAFFCTNLCSCRSVCPYREIERRRRYASLYR